MLGPIRTIMLWRLQEPDIMSPVDSIITLVAFLIAFALLLVVFVWCVKLEDTNSRLVREQVRARVTRF